MIGLLLNCRAVISKNGRNGRMKQSFGKAFCRSVFFFSEIVIVFLFLLSHFYAVPKGRSQAALRLRLAHSDRDLTGYGV